MSFDRIMFWSNSLHILNFEFIAHKFYTAEILTDGNEGQNWIIYSCTFYFIFHVTKFKSPNLEKVSIKILVTTSCYSLPYHDCYEEEK
jgi:hypothetical protein